MTSPRPVPLARRALPALAVTGAGAALLVALDHPTGLGVVAAEPASATITTATTPTSQATTAPTTDPAVVAPATSAPMATTASTATASTAATAAPAAAGSCTGETVAGPVVETRWGPVQVTAVFATDGTICDLTATGPTDDRKSVSINARALPVLHDRAIAAQGTDFQAVSGATVTSEGYRTSLQAILDAR